MYQYRLYKNRIGLYDPIIETFSSVFVRYPQLRTIDDRNACICRGIGILVHQLKEEHSLLPDVVVLKCHQQ